MLSDLVKLAFVCRCKVMGTRCSSPPLSLPRLTLATELAPLKHARMRVWLLDDDHVSIHRDGSGDHRWLGVMIKGFHMNCECQHIQNMPSG